MNSKPEKLDGRSLDLRAQRLAALKALLPEAFDLDGQLVQDKLLAALEPVSYEATDDIPTFGLGWPGKQQAFAAAGVPTTATLRPVPDGSGGSVDFDTTRNLLIEGDNLEVLKTLQRGYHGKVKMIYIDPPYNTGKDFVYPDNYGEGLDTYLQRTQQKDDDGFWKSTNNDTTGRKHANWLSMMAPRLTLARNLLSDDGVIFISIDDNEATNLRALCDEVFGAENFIISLCHKSRASVSNDKIVSSNHNHVLLYARNKATVHDRRHDFGLKPNLEGFDKEDEHGKYKLATVDGPGGGAKGNPHYTFLGVTGYFRFSLKTMEEMYKEGLVVKVGSGLQQKNYLDDARGKRRTTTSWWDEKLYTSSATTALKQLMGGEYFDNPKHPGLVRKMLELWAREKGELILDFFAGSGTTGHAVMAQNAADGGNRKYICVQLPEPLDEPVTLDDGVVCETIFDLTRERLKRAGKKIKDEAGLNAGGLDTGFRVFRLDSSNFTAWNSDPATAEADLLDRLDQVTDHTVPGRTETDLLWEVLLKMGLTLDHGLERFEIENAEFIGVADRAKVISTQADIPTAAFEALLAPLEGQSPPQELVVLDQAFADDTARANVATLYRQTLDDDDRPVCTLKVV